MKFLFTGASGFLGSNTIYPLQKEGYKITTLGISDHNNIKANLGVDKLALNTRFNIVLHAAGKAHSVPKNQMESQSFFDINFKGTKSLCSALEQFGIPQAFIFISTVAVYGVNAGENITEEHALCGTSPYALSKIQAESFLQEWCAKHNVKLSILRPSLIAGKNPPGNLGTMIQGIKTGKYFSVAGGKARKSILMADDVAKLIPKLAITGGIYNICDDYHPSFGELEELIAFQLNTKKPSNIPYWIAKSMALIGDMISSKAPINSNKLEKMTQSLTFSNAKAKQQLGWEPMDVLSNFKIT